jgi:hypothetical protein
MVYITDGLEEEVSTLTVFTNIAREIVVLSNTPVRVFYHTELFFCIDCTILLIGL